MTSYLYAYKQFHGIPIPPQTACLISCKPYLKLLQFVTPIEYVWFCETYFWRCKVPFEDFRFCITCPDMWLYGRHQGVYEEHLYVCAVLINYQITYTHIPTIAEFIQNTAWINIVWICLYRHQVRDFFWFEQWFYFSYMSILHHCTTWTPYNNANDNLVIDSYIALPYIRNSHLH